MLSKSKKALLCCLAANNININEQPEISRYRRELPPAHYSLKIQSFSSVKEKCENFISDVFEAQGHKWMLCLYPNGRKDNNLRSKKRANGYISLYLNIVETEAYPSGWQVHVVFKLFVFNKKHDSYFTVQDVDGIVRSFDEKNTQWGFSQFISYEDFYNPSNGFLVYDTCVFGAEVFILEPSFVKTSPMSEYPTECVDIFTWDVKGFSKRENWVYIESELFEVGELAWTFSVYPKGHDGGTHGRKGRVALCLYLHHAQDLSSSKNISLEYKMQIINKDNSTKNLERASSGSVHLSKGASRYEEDIISLKDLQEPSSGFIKNDTLTVQVQDVLP